VDLEHPTYLWSWLTHPYLHEVVVPAITLGRELALDLSGSDPARTRVNGHG